MTIVHGVFESNISTTNVVINDLYSMDIQVDHVLPDETVGNNSQMFSFVNRYLAVQPVELIVQSSFTIKQLKLGRVNNFVSSLR